MEITVNEDFVQKAHEDAAKKAAEVGAGNGFKRMAERYVDGHWKRFIPKVELFSKPLKGGVFVDYGCKYGHLTPLLIDQGIKQVYSVDVNEEYLHDGPLVFGDTYPVEYFRSKNCYVDIPSGSADFILTNEVISHINPAFLDVYYSEVARILKPGGELIISDGNNWMHEQTRLDLLDWYHLWEDGYSKEFKDANYLSQRTTMIKNLDQSLSSEDVGYLAKNTSGLWGSQIESAIEDFKNGCFVERAYRPGSCPTHPTIGVMMEKAFDPTQVIRALEMHGLSANQVLRGEERDDLMMIGATKNFTIRARKLPEDVESLQDFARTALAADDRQFKAEDKEMIGAANMLDELIRTHAEIGTSNPGFEKTMVVRQRDLFKVLGELLKQARRDKRLKVVETITEVRERLMNK